MGLWGKKNTTEFADGKLISEYLDRLINGDCTPANESDYNNPELARKLNAFVNKVKLNNDVFVMKLNLAMNEIGDSSCVKDMLGQLDSQVSSIQEMQNSSSDISNSIETIADSANDIKNNTHVAISQTNKTVDELTLNANNISHSCEQFADISQKINALETKIEKINEIIDIVKKISSKSSLLALNASIEAARAGEAGKSFAVVASQMQDLAKSTSESAVDVTKYVDDLKESLKTLFVSINDTTKELEEGNTQMAESVADMQNITDTIETIGKDIDKISEELSTQLAITQNFSSSIEEIAGSYSKLEEECIDTGSHLYKISRKVDSVRSNMSRRLSNLSTLDWLNIFKTDHLIFTWRQYNNIVGFEKLKLEQVNNPDGCKLGKWLASQANTKIADSDCFKEIKIVHKQLHDYSVSSFKYAAENDKEKAFKEFQNAYLCFEKLTLLIDNLAKIVIKNGDTRVTEIN